MTTLEINEESSIFIGFVARIFILRMKAREVRITELDTILVADQIVIVDVTTNNALFMLSVYTWLSIRRGELLVEVLGVNITEWFKGLPTPKVTWPDNQKGLNA